MTEVKEAPPQPSVKVSKNPHIQENVDAMVKILRGRFPDASEAHLHAQARDRVAHQLDKARMKREIQAKHKVSITDELTGFLNSTGFNEMLTEEGLLIARTGKSAAVLVLDADGLKELNDTMGHTAGDELLKKIARILHDSTRASDTKAFSEGEQTESQENEQTRVARWGGDEFGVVLGDINSEGAFAWWRRASRKFREEGISIGAGLQMVSPLELMGRSRTEIKEIMQRKRSEADLAMMMLAKPQSRETGEPVLVAYNSIPQEQIPALTQQAEQMRAAKATKT